MRESEANSMKTSLVAARLGLATVALLPAVHAAAQTAAVAEQFGKDVDAQIVRHYTAVEVLYQDIHTNPEPAFEEVATAKKLATQMRELGFAVTEPSLKTSIKAIESDGADRLAALTNG